MPIFSTQEMRDLQTQIDEAQGEFEKLINSADSTDESLKAASDRVKELTEDMEDLKRTQIASFIGKVGDSLSKGLKAGFTAVSGVVKAAIDNNDRYFQSLNQIVGINGKVGELGTTLRDLASGVVGKQDLADFFGRTGDIIAGADAMEEQAGYARDLIAAYGSVEVAAQKYRNIMILSVEDQKTALALAERQAEIVENSAAGQIQAIQTQMQDAMDNIGQSILYTLKPIIDFIGQIATAFRELSGVAQLDDKTAALEKNLKLTEEEKRVAEELNEIERLQANGFTSSLDEVHETGSAYVEAQTDGEQAQDDADKVVEAEQEKQDAMSKTSESAYSIAEAMMSVFDIVQSVGEIFSTVFESIGPELLDIIGWIGDVVSGFVAWADSVGLLKPLLVTLTGVIIGVKAAQLALAAANAIASITAIAATGPAALATAGIVGAAVGIGVGIMSGIGLAVGSSGVSTPTSDTGSSNDYSGTRNESGTAEVAVYLDGKKVNDALANEDYFNTEVKIS